jgi:hypothetical protein
MFNSPLVLIAVKFHPHYSACRHRNDPKYLNKSCKATISNPTAKPRQVFAGELASPSTSFFAAYLAPFLDIDHNRTRRYSALGYVRPEAFELSNVA